VRLQNNLLYFFKEEILVLKLDLKKYQKWLISSQKFLLITISKTSYVSEKEKKNINITQRNSKIEKTEDNKNQTMYMVVLNRNCNHYVIYLFMSITEIYYICKYIISTFLLSKHHY